MGKKDTEIREPGGLLPGEVVGHADKNSRITKPNGLFGREELGYVDGEGHVRRPDGFFRGDEVGRVRGDRAYAPDGFFGGEETGYVDRDGNIRRPDGLFLRGDVVGEVRGDNRVAALGYFTLKFRELEDRCASLEREVQSARDKVTFLGRVRGMLEAVPRAKVLGDVDGLVDRLRALERQISDEMDDRRRRKEAICAEADALSVSTEWKAAGEGLRALFEGWRAIGPAGRDSDDALWARFQAARNAFHARRTAFFETRDRERAANRAAKEAICARAEGIGAPSDWRTAAETLRALFEEWRSIGPAGKDVDAALWARFGAARQAFYDRRAAYYAANRQRKEALCAKAEAYSYSSEWKVTGEALQGLLAEWKTVGPAGKEDDDALWGRFQAARQAFHARRTAYFEQRDREQQQNLWQKEALCSEVEVLVGATDTRAAMDALKAAQAAWKAIGPVPRDRADALWARFRAACDRAYADVQLERERKRAAWEANLRETVDRKRAQASQVAGSIAHDEDNVDRWEDTIANLRPGSRADEIRYALEGKIADVSARIDSKRARLGELEAAIADIESRLGR